METIRKKKKNVILRCELYACYELLTSWIQSLFQTIQLGYYQTTKKKKCSKTKRVVLEPFVPTGKEQLRNYFNHTMFA